jgi:hypothetical protein
MSTKAKSKAQKKALAQSLPPQKEAIPSGSTSESQTEATLEEDFVSSGSKVANECSAVVKTFVQGARYDEHVVIVSRVERLSG